MTLSDRVCDKALALGLDLVGVAPAVPVPHLEAYQEWLARGHHGEMAYLARADRVERRQNPGVILPGARSIVCVALNHYPGDFPGHTLADPARGRIARYAWGMDYHDLLLPRLEELASYIAAQSGTDVNHRVYVDTGPILERGYAAAAGLGFVGRNTNLIHPKLGSYLLLGEILVDIRLDPTPSPSRGRCGTCHRCLDACPTGALVAPHVLDARRCISYLTIELTGSIPPDLRPLVGNWVYGCDICQEVCPWQRFATRTAERAFLAVDGDRAAPRLTELAGTNQRSFAERYDGSPLARVGRSRLLRNVAVALGNWRQAQALAPLEHLLGDPNPLVRSHAAWALGRVEGHLGREALEKAAHRESDPEVRTEIRQALEHNLTTLRDGTSGL